MDTHFYLRTPRTLQTLFEFSNDEHGSDATSNCRLTQLPILVPITVSIAVSIAAVSIVASIAAVSIATVSIAAVSIAAVYN